MSKGMTILESTNEQDRANGMRSFTLEHCTRDTRSIIAMTVHRSENIAEPMATDPVWSADMERNIRNLDLAEMLTALNLHLLRIGNLCQIGTGPITIP